MENINKKYLQYGKSKFAFEDRSQKRMSELNRELKKRIEKSQNISVSK